MITLNYNHIRALAKKAKRPILQCIHYDAGSMYYTNSYIVIEAPSYSMINHNLNINVLDHTINNQPYPDVKKFIDKPFYVQPLNQAIYKNEVINYITTEQGYKRFITSSIIEDIKKLTGFKDIDQSLFRFNGSMLLYEVGSAYNIYSMLYHIDDSELTYLDDEAKQWRQPSSTTAS